MHSIYLFKKYLFDYLSYSVTKRTKFCSHPDAFNNAYNDHLARGGAKYDARLANNVRPYILELITQGITARYYRPRSTCKIYIHHLT
jgi:hypothetical protein